MLKVATTRESGLQSARGRDVPHARFTAIAPRAVEIVNAFYRRYPPLEATLAGRRALISVSWPPAPATDRYHVGFTVDGAIGELAVSASLVDLLLASLDPQHAVDGLTPEEMAVLLELAVSPELEAIEASLNCTISIATVRRRRESEDTELLSIDFALAAEGAGSSWAELRLPADPAARLARHLNIIANTAAPNVDLPVAVCLRLAAATFALHEIRSLSPGDVVLVDDHCRDTGMAIAVIAEHLVAPIEVISEGGRLIAGPRLGRGSSWEWSMERTVNDAPEVPDADLDGLPVRLVFELGRTEMSLAEIRRLAPGAIVPLARPHDQAVDIVANGRRIGRGSLVEIGDSLGVRVTRLFDHD